MSELELETKRPLCKSILIAEDNASVRETIEEVLANEGYEVHTARNGAEALEKLRGLPTPTLILLDLMMPVMNGWEFLEAQQADAVLAAHQVVTISAVPATQSLEDKTPLDTAGSMTKPLSLEPLLSKVAEYCGHPAESSAS